MARHGGTDFSAEGKLSFVVGAEILYGVVDGFREHADFDDCMEAKGWVVADGKPTVAASGPKASYIPTTAVSYYPDAPGSAPLQQNVQPSTEPVGYDPANFAREQAAFEAKRAAEAWFQAERVLNDGDPASRKELYLVLCGAGDGSACEMAAVLKHSVYR